MAEVNKANERMVERRGTECRVYAHNYFLILANTGLRVGETRNLTWSVLRTVDTDDGNRLVGDVSEKRG